MSDLETTDTVLNTRAVIEKNVLLSVPLAINKNVRLHLAPRFGKTKLILSVIERD